MNLSLKHIVVSALLLTALSSCKTGATLSKGATDGGTKLSEEQRVQLERTFLEGQRAKAIEDYEDASKKFQDVLTSSYPLSFLVPINLMKPSRSPTKPSLSTLPTSGIWSSSLPYR